MTTTRLAGAEATVTAPDHDTRVMVITITTTTTPADIHQAGLSWSRSLQQLMCIQRRMEGGVGLGVKGDTILATKREEERSVTQIFYILFLDNSVNAPRLRVLGMIHGSIQVGC